MRALGSPRVSMYCLWSSHTIERELKRRGKPSGGDCSGAGSPFARPYRSIDMKKAKPEHRIDYWRYHVAAQSFDQALKVIGHIRGITDSQPLFLPLMVALHVLYARPFRHEKTSRRIDEALVPGSYSSVHGMLLQMRDRIFAHHDKDSRITDDDTGVDLFQIIVEVRSGQMRPAMQIVYPTDFQRERVGKLCEHLYQACMTKAQDALWKCISAIPNDGVYRVSTDFEGRSPLLIRSELSTEQSRGHLKETKRRVAG